MAADANQGTATDTQGLESLMAALKSAEPNLGETDSSLLMRMLQDCTSADHVSQPLSCTDLQAACQASIKLFNCIAKAENHNIEQMQPSLSKQAAVDGFKAAPAIMQQLKSWSGSSPDAGSSQTALTETITEFLKLAKIALLSKQWLQHIGSDAFSAIAAAMRGAVKDCVVPLLSSLASQAKQAGGNAILQPFEQLVAIGRISADIIAGRLQGSQANELRSFAVLNLAWSSIVKLLLVVADQPDQNAIADTFQVPRLLQLLAGYVQHEVSVLMDQQELNQLKVVRFWAQHLIKLATTFHTAGQASWSSLAALVANIHMRMPLVSDIEGEPLQKICQEVRQLVLAKLSHTLAACLPDCSMETSSMPSWAEALVQSPEADASRTPSHLADIPVPGRLMAALDLLRHGLMLSASAQLQCAHHLLPFVMHAACEHLYAKASEAPRLRSAIVQAVTIFLAACCSHREDPGLWHVCEEFLFRQALWPSPLRLQLLADIWSAVIRRSSPQLAESHMGALHHILTHVAACRGKKDLPEAAHSQAVQQLVQLTAHLLLSVPFEQRQKLCFSLFMAALKPRLKDCNLAALRATVKVFQLASTASEPALHKGTQTQMLDEFNMETKSCPQERVAGMLQCMAEAVALQLNSNLKTQDASDSFAIAASKAVKADTGDAWAAPALQILYLLRHMLTAERLTALLPALLRLQDNLQAGPYVAALAACYTDCPSAAVQLFHSILQEQHWALKHEIMESLVVYMRSPNSGDIKQVLPTSLYNPDNPEGPFITLLKQHLHRNATLNQPACSPQECADAERAAANVFGLIKNVMTDQPLQGQSEQDGALQQELSSIIKDAVQALVRVHDALRKYPLHHQSQEVQEHLAQITDLGHQCAAQLTHRVGIFNGSC